MTDLTDRQRVERGHRAKRALEEFVSPEFAYARQQYLSRMIEVATTELHPQQRADKITTLAVAIRVLDEVESGVTAVFREGEHAREQMLKAEKIEQMTDAKQRLLKIAPQY